MRRYRVSVKRNKLSLPNKISLGRIVRTSRVDHHHAHIFAVKNFRCIVSMNIIITSRFDLPQPFRALRRTVIHEMSEPQSKPYGKKNPKSISVGVSLFVAESIGRFDES